MFVKHTSLTRHHRQHKPSCKLPDFICTRQMYSDSFCFQRSPPSVTTCFNNRRLLKVQVHTLDIAPLRSESPLQKRSGMARVLKGFHSFTCTRSSAIEWAIPVFVFPAITGILTMYTFAFEDSYVSSLPSYNWYSNNVHFRVWGLVRTHLRVKIFFLEQYRLDALSESSDNWSLPVGTKAGCTPRDSTASQLLHYVAV